MIELTPLIVRPLVGAVIGYITNDIAIRMLFRPRKAKYIFGHKIPFTPGIIPKEKSRIAASIGSAISKNLMNQEVLERTLLSEEMIQKIGVAFDSFINTQIHNNESIHEFIGHYMSKDDINAISKSVSSDITKQIDSVLANSNLGNSIARIATEHVITKVRNGLLGKIGADQFIALIAAPAESLLAKNINEMLANNASSIVGNIVGDRVEAFINMPMKELLAGRESQIAQMRSSLINLYRTLITEQLPKILAAIDISKIIESRINEMDVKESEKLILEVMKKELRAIVWLGALLGFIMGCINLLF